MSPVLPVGSNQTDRILEPFIASFSLKHTLQITVEKKDTAQLRRKEKCQYSTRIHKRECNAFVDVDEIHRRKRVLTGMVLFLKSSKKLKRKTEKERM